MAAADGLVLVSAVVGWGTCSGNALLGRNFSSILLLVPVLGNSAVSIHSSHRICGTSLPDFCSEEDFRINAQGESGPCWESIGFVEEEEQDSEEEAEEEFPTGDDEEEKQSIF
ncbi:hypothetical protein HPP92_010817 [Vanilla planifolia]|uniref:Uncharacterized protein n=1 Tax=Vanilla planifolia TaxID=51239 RepID=A0A835RAE3_VANPL|nr:hypothetical protein HPP92_010817 [Vanilla planifolia]